MSSRTRLTDYMALSAASAMQIDEIVEWMIGEVERDGFLNHDAAAVAIWDRYGYAFAGVVKWTDKHGRQRRGRRLHPDVVKAFRKRTAKTVVAEKDDHAWRKRKSPA